MGQPRSPSPLGGSHQALRYLLTMVLQPGGNPWTQGQAGKNQAGRIQAQVAGEAQQWGSSNSITLVSLGKATTMQNHSSQKPERCVVSLEITQSIANPGPKPVQGSWCGEEMPLADAHHPSWEPEEEVEIGMWNNTPSQEVNQTGNWPYVKKPSKVRNHTVHLLHAVLFESSCAELRFRF